MRIKTHGREPRGRSHLRLRRLLPGLAGLLVVVPAALAVQTPIDGVDLVAGDGHTFFDADNDQPGNDGCLTADIRDEDAYTPVDNGFTRNDDDAFDGGVLMLVNGRSFVDLDGNGNLVGRQLTVGPQKLGGFKIRRIDRALGTSPTLRSLISIKNPKRKAKRVRVTVENDYGADDDEVVRASSRAPRRSYTRGDKWVVIADDAVSPSDAIVTHAFFGKGAEERVARVPNGIGNADSCLNVRYRIRVPAKSKRFLMLFTQLHGADQVSRAKDRARKLGKTKLPKRFKKGLKKGVKARILNWDL